MRKLLLFTLGFAVALLLLSYHTLVILLGTCLLGVLAWRRGFFRQGLPCLLYLCVGGLFGFCYLWVYGLSIQQVMEEYHEKTADIQGIVLDFPQKENYSYSLLVELALPEGKVKTLLYADEQVEGLEPGDSFATKAYLRRGDQTFAGVEIAYYTSKGILLRGVTSGVLESQEQQGFPWAHLPAYLAKWLGEQVESQFSSPYAGTVLALSTGNTTELSTSFSSGLNRVGLAHTVAVSGMHLAFLLGMLQILLPSRRLWATFLSLGLAVLFLLVTGSPPSMIRATIMAIVFQMAGVFRRDPDHLSALSLAVLVILLQNPFAISHVGFQLSVASVAGICLYAQPWQKKILDFFHSTPEKRGFFLANTLWASVCVTLSAMVFTTPLLAYYYGSVSLISPLSNLLCLWAVALAFAGGMGATLLGAVFPLLGTLLAYPVVALLSYLHLVIPWLGKFPFASVPMSSPYYLAWLCFVYVLLYYHSLSLEESLPLTSVCLSCGCFALVAVLHRESYFQHQMTLTLLDVGQGQCLLMTLGDRLVLADCGGSGYENPGDIAGDAISALGRTHLDLLVLSHCHYDHAGGVAQLLERVTVDTIAMPAPSGDSTLEEEILQLAEKRGINLQFIVGETRIDLGEDKEIRLLPPVTDSGINERGVVLLVTVGEEDVLVTGDISATTEELVLETFSLPEIELLVVGHHGSRFSTSPVLLDCLDPALALISVGSSNNYGHPTAEVLWRLESRGILTYRTDTGGALGFFLPV